MQIKPWIRAPADLLLHGEEHFQGTRDIDRRMALISFDNVIEIAVVTHLALDPRQRGNLHYPREKVVGWRRNFHTKLAFIEEFAATHQRPMQFQTDELLHVHNLRNELYHGGTGSVPAMDALWHAREAAKWVLELLFDVDASKLIADGLEAPPAPPLRPTAQTELLGRVIEVRRAADELREVADPDSHAPESLSERVASAISRAPEAKLASAHLLSEAEKVSRRLVEGLPPGLNDAQLRDLSGALGSVAMDLQARLREHQRDMVEKSLTAIENAAREGISKAGIVQFVRGAGVTQAVIALLARCRESTEVGNMPLLLVTDRRILIEELRSSIQSHAVAGDLLAEVDSSSVESLRECIAGGRSLVLTTQQQLQAIERPLPGRMIVIAMTAPSPADRWKVAVPGGIFLHIVDHVWPGMDAALPIVSQYSLSDAISDNLLRPVVVDELPLPAIEVCSLGASKTLALMATKVIEDLIRASRAESPAKGVVLLERIRDVDEFRKLVPTLLARYPDCSIHVGALTSTSPSGHQLKEQHVFRECQNHALLAMTVQMLGALHLPMAATYYVCAPLSPRQQTRIIVSASRAAQHGSAHGRIVDCYGSSWNPRLLDALDN